MSNEFKEELAACEAAFAKHTLRSILRSDGFCAYMLEEQAGSRMNAVLITFTPEGIVINGDHAPGRNGLCSTAGYGKAWFSEPKCTHYLCEKFGVPRTFQNELALEWLRDQMAEAKELEQDVRVHEMIEILDSGVIEEHEFQEQLQEWGFDDSFNIGVDYDYMIAAKLTAIQHRFAALVKDIERD